MGLFGFGKKKNPSAEFYSQCVADFHKEALKHDVAKKGLIFIPELMPVGEDVVSTFLNDEFLNAEYRHNPIQFYYAVMLFVWESGIVAAAKWHEDFSDLNGYMTTIKIVGPAEHAEKLLKKHFPASIAQTHGDQILRGIYPRFIEMLSPYMKQTDVNSYLCSAFLAVYQLGVSMMLEKLGY